MLSILMPIPVGIYPQPDASSSYVFKVENPNLKTKVANRINYLAILWTLSDLQALPVTTVGAARPNTVGIRKSGYRGEIRLKRNRHPERCCILTTTWQELHHKQAFDFGFVHLSVTRHL